MIVDPGVVIGPRAEIGSGSIIGANSVIGSGVRIGRDCLIGPQVTMSHALIGDRVILHPGVRIGQSGSISVMPRLTRRASPGCRELAGSFIQDGVEIGANATIDRGAAGDTVIGEETRIGNLARIAENVAIGRHCVIPAQAGLSAGARLEDFASELNAACPAGFGIRSITEIDQAILDDAIQSPQLGERQAMSEAAPATIETFDILRLLKSLPHRYPFLMVDRVIEARGDEFGIGIKNVSINEPQFQGHFPERPVMPGVLLIEGMAQTAGVLCVNAHSPGRKPPLVYFMSIDKAKFRKPVLPGDRVEFHMTKTNRRRTMWWYQGRALVEGVLVCEAEIAAMLAEEQLRSRCAPVAPRVNSLSKYLAENQRISCSPRWDRQPG